MLYSTVVQATENPEACLNLEDAARLACYDRVAGAGEGRKEQARRKGTAGNAEGASQGAGRDGESPEYLPKGDVFRPLIADPKQPKFHTSFYKVRFEEPRREFTGWFVGRGAFGLIWWPGTNAGGGWQPGISAALFAQFDLDAPSQDLLNTDGTWSTALK